MTDDLESHLAAALRSTAEERTVEDRWDRIAERSHEKPLARGRFGRSLPVLVAAAVIVIGLVVAAVVVTTRSSRVAGVTDVLVTSNPTVGREPSTAVSSVVPIDLATSGWVPGNGGDGALLAGRLTIDAGGCVRVGTTVAIWPRGFTARLDDQKLELLDPAGRVTARGGDELALGGGSSAGPATGPCSSVIGEVFQVQSDVRIVGVPIDLPTSDWRAGDLAMEALLTGPLMLGGNGCVTVGGTTVLWPSGWTARTSVSGVEILDSAGEVFAESNQVIEAGGGMVPLPADQVTSCSPGSGTFSIQGEITVVG